MFPTYHQVGDTCVTQSSKRRRRTGNVPAPTRHQTPLAMLRPCHGEAFRSLGIPTDYQTDRQYLSGQTDGVISIPNSIYEWRRSGLWGKGKPLSGHPHQWLKWVRQIIPIFFLYKEQWFVSHTRSHLNAPYACATMIIKRINDGINAIIWVVKAYIFSPENLSGTWFQ